MHEDDMQDRHGGGFADGFDDDRHGQDVHGSDVHGPDVPGQGPAGQPPPRGRNVWRIIGVVAIAVLIAGGLAYLGFMALLMMAMSSYGSNK
jgi:hypothetical protein